MQSTLDMKWRRRTHECERVVGEEETGDDGKRKLHCCCIFELWMLLLFMTEK